MTVKELIKILEKQDQLLEVKIFSNRNTEHGEFILDDIEEIGTSIFSKNNIIKTDYLFIN